MKNIFKKLQKIYNESFGKNIVEGIQAVKNGIGGGVSIGQNLSPEKPEEKKEEVKDQQVVGPKLGDKILSSGVKLDQTIVNKAFNDSLKSKREKLNNLVIQKILKTLVNFGVEIATVIAVGTAVKALLSGPIGWSGLAIALSAIASLLAKKHIKKIVIVNGILKFIGVTDDTLTFLDIAHEYKELDNMSNYEYFIDC